MPDESIDPRPFKRGGPRVVMAQGGRYTSAFELHALAQLGYGMDPRSVPIEALRIMGSTCPAVYPAERTITGIIRRSDLFSVKHEDPKIVAETEAWLWPLLPRLLGGCARGFSYGTVANVLDWERRTLRTSVRNVKTGKVRSRTSVDHTHFARAFELHPDYTSFGIDEQGEIVTLDAAASMSIGALGRAGAGSRTYDATRVAPWIWDPEFGEVVGQGARQRAWQPYCTYLIVRLLRDKYLERSVDSPRIVFAPEGKITIDGVETTIPEYAVQLLMDLSGSGAIGFPSATDAQGKEKYRVQTLDLPDRGSVWAEALDRAAGEVYQAYLVPPPMAGALEDAGGAATKALDGMLREFIEDLALFGAAGLTRLVHIVHAKNYDPAEIDPPDVVATDVGKAAARKIYMEVLRLANSAARGELSMRTDVPALLDKLGIPLREPPLDPFAEKDPSGEEPGRPRKQDGEREERREDSPTQEGEEDTGGDDVEREERPEGRAGPRHRASRARDDGGMTFVTHLPALAVTVQPSAAAVTVQPSAANVLVQPARVDVRPNVHVSLEAPAQAPTPVTVVNENHVHVPEPKPLEAHVTFERRRGDDKLMGAEITES